MDQYSVWLQNMSGQPEPHPAGVNNTTQNQNPLMNVWVDSADAMASSMSQHAGLAASSTILPGKVHDQLSMPIYDLDQDTYDFPEAHIAQGSLQDEANDLSEDDQDHQSIDHISARRQRSHMWPPLSDPHTVISKPSHFQTKTIGNTGREAGRNLLAIFSEEDNMPRTCFNIRILRGRPQTYLPDARSYPQSNTVIPAGMTLQEICLRYPRHVWGTGLRMYIAEGWTGEQIFNALPADFKDSRATQRQWNYVQQGFTREVRRINQEDGVSFVRVPRMKRARSQSVEREQSETPSLQMNEVMSPAAHLPMLGPSTPPTANLWQRAGVDHGTLQRDTFMEDANVDQEHQGRSGSPSAPSTGTSFGGLVARFQVLHELELQEEIMLDILDVEADQFCDEGLEERRARVCSAREELFESAGWSLREATVQRLKAFTMWLKKEHRICWARPDV